MNQRLLIRASDCNGADEAVSGSDFDVELANVIASREAYNKHLYRPNNYLHKWWARRCGSTFRLILKCLVRNPAQRNYYTPGGLEGFVILDPMMGGGTTLHEAVRMGASVIGADIDPIPVLQARATLSQIPFEQLEGAFNTLLRRIDDRLGHLFTTHCPYCDAPTPIQFTLWGLMQFCSCKSVVAVDSFVLRQEGDGSNTLICPRCRAIHRGVHNCCSAGNQNVPLLVEKKKKRCDDCGCNFREDISIPYYKRYHPIVVTGVCANHGKFFRTVSDFELRNLEEADRLRANLAFDPAQFIVSEGPKSADLKRRGVLHYLDLFSSRQILFIDSAISCLAELDPLVRLNLALLISTSLEFNSMLCGYKGADKRRPGAIRHTFSHHAYSFPYTALENNPVYPKRSSGNLKNLFDDRLRRARRWAQAPTERLVTRGQVSTVTIPDEVDAGVEVHTTKDLLRGPRRFLLHQGSSFHLPIPSASVDHVVTDPPYFDSVQYGDLAAFFRVWLRQMLPDAASWDYDLSEAAVEQNGCSNGQYAQVLTGIFQECRRVLKNSGLLIFTFHHWNPKGWTDLTLALRRAGFRLRNRHVVHSENPVSVHIANLRSLMHDAILILCRDGSQAPHWDIPETIPQTDSYAFCLGCATTLGALLNSEYTEEDIAAIWQKLLS